jgi:hypothetical protein
VHKAGHQGCVWLAEASATPGLNDMESQMHIHHVNLVQDVLSRACNQPR